MRIKIYTLILSLLFISCNEIQLVESNIKYTDLPTEVKKSIFEDKFVDLNKPKKYREESSKTFLPWIYETRLIRIKDNKSYKIDFNKEYDSSTLIVLGDYLYTTNNYNIYEQDSLTYTFSKYIIK